MNDLVTATVSAIAPYLPLLVTVGREAGKAVIKKGTDAATDRAVGLLSRLRDRFKGNTSATEALHYAAQNPDDADALAQLRVQLKQLLAQDPAFADELRHLLASVPAAVTVTAPGERSVAAQNISGSTIITGDGAAGQRKF